MSDFCSNIIETLQAAVSAYITVAQSSDSDRQRLDAIKTVTDLLAEIRAELYGEGKNDNDIEVELRYVQQIARRTQNLCSQEEKELIQQHISALTQALRNKKSQLADSSQGLLFDVFEKYIDSVLKDEGVKYRPNSWPLVVELNFGGSGSGNDFDQFVTALVENKLFIKYLEMLHMNDGFSKLLKIIQSNRIIDTLSSSSESRKELSDVQCVQFADALKQNNTIRHISLANQHCGNNGASAFADLLVSSECVLVSLDLSENEIGDDGARALLVAISKNVSLQTFYIRINKISDTLRKQIHAVCKRKGIECDV